MDTPWQNGPSFLMLPREDWPVSREFKTKIPEEEVVKTIKSLASKISHVKVSSKSVCLCKVCSLLSDPCDFSTSGKATKPGDSSHYQSLYHILTRTSKLQKARGVMA